MTNLPAGLSRMISALQGGAHTVDELAIICDTTPAQAETWLELCVCYKGAHLAPGGDLSGKKRWTMMEAES